MTNRNILRDRASGQYPDFWAMSDLALARSCLWIAATRWEPHDLTAQAEAARLQGIWRDTTQAPDTTLEQRDRRAMLVAGLRKRTIQILVRLSLKGLVVTPGN